MLSLSRVGLRTTWGGSFAELYFHMVSTVLGPNCAFLVMAFALQLLQKRRPPFLHILWLRCPCHSGFACHSQSQQVDCANSSSFSLAACRKRCMPQNAAIASGANNVVCLHDKLVLSHLRVRSLQETLDQLCLGLGCCLGSTCEFHRGLSWAIFLMDLLQSGNCEMLCDAFVAPLALEPTRLR